MATKDITKTGPQNWRELQEQNIPLSEEIKNTFYQTKALPVRYDIGKVYKNAQNLPVLTALEYNQYAEQLGLGESKFDRTLSVGDITNITPEIIQNVRADQQSGIAQIGQGLTKLVTTAATTVIDDIAGTLYGLGQGVVNWASNGWNTYLYQDGTGKTYNSRDGYDLIDGNIVDSNGRVVGTEGKEISSYNNLMDGFVNNDISRALHTFNDKMREWMPTYTSSQYEQNREEGRWWRNMGSSAWWADMLENTGFMVGTAIAMTAGPRIPYIGRGINAFSRESLNATRDVISKATKVALDEADDAARATLRGVKDLTNIPDEVARAAKRLRTKNIINTVQGSTIAAMGESRLESLSAGDQIAAKGNDIEQNYQQAMQSVDQEVQLDYPEWFDMIEYEGNVISVPNEQAKAEIERRKNLYTQQRNGALALIANQAKSMSNHVFGWNMFVLTASNALAFNQFMNPGQQWMRMNTKSVTGESFRNITKRLEQQGMSKDAIKTEIKRLKDIEKANKAAIRNGKFVDGKFEKGVDLKANWWQTRGKNIGRALLSPAREGIIEEMGQGVAQEAADYSAASKLNEFYGYTFDEKGLDESVSWINALGRGFNETYFNPKGWEQGVMGALTSVIPLPMMGFRMSRNRNEQGKKKFNFTMTNEFWHNLTSKEEYNKAKELAKQYNDLYNDPNGMNMAIVNALARAEGLNRQYQDAVDNDDTYSIIGINNKKFWNLVTLYNKLGRISELESILQEIQNTDAEQVGEQVLEAYKAEELDGYIDKSQLDPKTIGEKVIDNAKQYQSKLNSFLENEKNIYNLYGSEDSGSLNEEYLTELSFITANIQSLEDRWKEILQNTPESLTNVLYTLLNTRQLDEQEGSEISELISKFINNKNEFEDLSTLTSSYKNNSIIKAINTVLSKVNDKQLDSDSIIALNSIKDLNRILQDRATYIERLNKLANNPQAFSDAAKELSDTFMNNMREANIDRVVNQLRDVKTVNELTQVLGQLNTNYQITSYVLKEALKRLATEGNSLASDLYKSNNFINLVYRDLNLSKESPEVIAEAERMFDILQNNAENFDELSNITGNPLLSIQNLPTNPEEQAAYLDLHNRAIELLTNIVNENKEAVNTSVNSSRVSEEPVNTEESVEDDDLSDIQIENFDELSLDGMERSDNEVTTGPIAPINLNDDSHNTSDNSDDNSNQGATPTTHTPEVTIETVQDPKDNVEYSSEEVNRQPINTSNTDDDNNQSSRDFKGAYMAMQEFDVIGKNINSFQRPTEKMPSYTTLYNFLKDTLHVFDNVDGKNPNVRIEAGTKVYFGISPKLDEQIKANVLANNPESKYEPFTVLMFIKDSTGHYHCVGNLLDKVINELGLKDSLQKELSDKLNNTTSDYIVSTQYSSVEKILTGVVKMRGTDYKSLKELIPNNKLNNRKLAIVRGGRFVIGNNELTNQVVPINHDFPEGSAVLLCPTMAYDKTKSLENQPARAFFPVILKKNYFSFNQIGNITARVNGILSKIATITKARQVDELAYNLKHQLLMDYQTSDNTFQTVHINPMGWQDGKLIEINRDDERIAKSGRTYNEMPVSAIQMEVRNTTTDDRGNRTVEVVGRVLIQLKDENNQRLPINENDIKTFIEQQCKAKYQIDKNEIANPMHVLDLIANNALSTNIENPEMLEVKSNSFKLTAMSSDDIKSDNIQPQQLIQPSGDVMTAEEIKNFEEGIIGVLNAIEDKSIKWENAFDLLDIPQDLIAKYPKPLAQFIQQQWNIIQRNNVTSTTTTVDDLLDEDDKFSNETLTPQRERYTEESLNRELANLARMLPNMTEQQRIKLIDDLVPVVQNGQRIADAGGKFSRGIIILSKHAMIGTAYHEAFHAVFGLMLTNDEKNEILEAAKKVWGDLSNKELEEKLAEGFREYSMTRDEYGLGEKIINFFKRLLGIIDNWEDIQLVFNDLYRNIYEGKYGNKVLKSVDNIIDNEVRYSINRSTDRIKVVDGKPMWVNKDGSVKRELTVEAFQKWVDNLVNNTSLNVPNEGNDKTQQNKRWSKFAIDRSTEGVALKAKYDNKKKGYVLTEVKLENPTILSDEVYASLSPAERETARYCSSK